ncbi:MAG: HAMP domain-containing protein [Chloroflexi bacterium]|nr:HAMP domain-containing protein [Chloroflexota bacterium]
MRSLRLKLIFTFLVISIAGTLIAALIVSRSNEQAFDDLLMQQGQANFVQNALNYYQTNGSWKGVVQFFRPSPAPALQGQDQPPPFALADSDGRILIPNGSYLPGSEVPQPELDRGVPIELDGQRIGTALTVNRSPPRNDQEEAFVAQTNQALLIGGLGGTAVAILLGIILARTLTRPLRELSRASRQVAQGQLQQAVPVRTQDELGELAAAFNQMSAALDRANQARRQMTADIAHDLRTPLTVLSGYLEAMQDGTLAPTPARFNLMRQEINTLNRLVSDLRTLSLADAGKLTLQLEPIAPADLLTQVQAAYAHQAAQQTIALQVECAPDLSAANLDPERMKQVLGNLIGNAFRYTPAGGTIILAADQLPAADCQLRITVTDTGPGIPSADLPHIFNRFYRGDKSRHEAESSGLGLAIARSLVKAHGGEITAVSPIVDGRGTRFIITLPG